VLLGTHRAGGLVGRPHREVRHYVGTRQAPPDDAR